MTITLSATNKEGKTQWMKIEHREPIREKVNTQYALREAFAQLQLVAWDKVSKVKVSIINQ